MKPLSLTAVAKLAGVHPLTLERWLSSGDLAWPKTVIANGHILRLWEDADVERIRRHKEAQQQRTARKKAVRAATRDQRVRNQKGRKEPRV